MEINRMQQNPSNLSLSVTRGGREKSGDEVILSRVTDSEMSQIEALKSMAEKGNVEKKITDFSQEKLAGIGMQDNTATVFKLLGEPEEISKEEFSQADGMKHYDFIYSEKGIKINFADGEVSRVTFLPSCKEGTSKGIKVGDDSSKVRNNYEINEDDSNKNSLMCGTVYGGIVFKLTDGGKVESIEMGCFAE